MDEFYRKTIEQFRNFWLDLEPTRKISLAIIFMLVLTIMIAIISWASKTRYKVLFTEMNREDASMVARLLEEKKVSYLLSDDSKTISIPEDQVEILRIELAKQGLSLTGTVGYEVFDKQEFGTTSFVQKVNKQRALEGELIKTIKYIKGVKRARVHLNIPEISPFASEQKEPTGAVVLELNMGVTLIPSEIRGVQSLVAGSVDGMRVENVVVIDSAGKKLSENVGDQMTADTANRIQLEAKMNQQYERQIEEILSKVVGTGKVVAKVAIKLDFTQTSTTETTYDDESKAVLAEVQNSQKLVGTRPSPQGIPGARSNLPGETPQPGIPETKNDVDKSTITRNYNVPSKVKKFVNPTASIISLSASVMLDGKSIINKDKNGKIILDDNGFPTFSYLAWTPQEIRNFTDIVSNAVGIDSTRGDKIVITNMPFIKEDLSAADALLRAKQNREIIKNIVKYVAIGLLMTLFFVIVVRPFIQWVTENTVESVEDFLPKTLEELEKIQADQKLPGLEDALPQIEEKLNPEKIEGNMLKEKIITLVEANPAKAAQIVHSMIHQIDSEKQIA